MDLNNSRYDLVLNSVTNANVAGSDQHCREDDASDKSIRQRRRGLRYSIPYVESFEEQTAREIWEKNCFQCAEHVIDRIILSGNDGNGCNRNTEVQAVLTPIKSGTDNPTSTSVLSSLSGYEDSFDLLYKGENGSVIDLSANSCDSNQNEIDVIGTASIVDSTFALTEETGAAPKDKMNNFCLRVAYRGTDFCGWQTQLNNFEKPSVQRTLEEWLTELQNDRPLDADENTETKRTRRAEKPERLDGAGSTTTRSGTNSSRKKKDDKFSDSRRIKWADLPVAGRTDSGVSAIGQLCRFRTYRKDLTIRDIQKYLRDRIRNTPGFARSLSVTDITRVTKAFHPTFTTSCRAYAYLFDTVGGDGTTPPGETNTITSAFIGNGRTEEQVALLDAMLRRLEGKPLDYIGLSYGRVKTQNTICTLYHARARLVEYHEPPAGAGAGCDPRCDGRVRSAVCIELVGNRFLRRMVRLLVEASVRLVATADRTRNTASDGDDTGALLLELIQKRDRRLVGRPAPPDGLLFVGARVRSEPG